ncbi:MAG: glycosyltransferase family 39 protein [Terriglobales bacterium]
MRYIPNVLTLVREHRRWFLGTLLAGLVLRLFFFIYFPMVTDDSRIYADLASNWLQHGIYGQTQTGSPGAGTAESVKIVPTDARLPGYPAFLAVIFWLFGTGNFRAVMLAQILVDLATCLVVADMARRMISDRAAKIAFLLAALCPFLANYAAADLTETLEIFFTALALDATAAALNRMREGGVDTHKLWAAAGVAIAACILLRPDGGILLAAVLLYVAVSAPKGAANFGERTASLKRCPDTKPEAQGPLLDTKPETRWPLPDSKPEARRPLLDSRVETRGHRKFDFLGNALVGGVLVATFALAPLVPWTIRNLHTLHHFQPLAPRYANDADELVPRGFNRWVKTWIVDYVSVEEVYWNVPGDKIDPAKLPSRALENPAERDATLAAIADYNESQDMTPELDARFGQLAADRIHAHPIRYYVALPALRVADMWLRPRTELLPPDPRWWEFNDDAKHSAVAVGFGLMNLAYVAAAGLAIFHRGSSGPSGIRWAGLLVGFLLLRSAFLGSVESPEPRYTLECYPVIIVLASAWLTGVGKKSAVPN